jgi:hypothetical protein
MGTPFSEHVQHVGGVPLCKRVPVRHEQGREGGRHTSADQVPVEQDLEPLACPPPLLHHPLCQPLSNTQRHQSHGKGTRRINFNNLINLTR